MDSRIRTLWKSLIGFNKLPIEKLLELEQQGKLVAKRGYLDLIIWHYSRETQFEQLWDEYTISLRAMVTNESGEIVARCIPKFFNFSEFPSLSWPVKEPVIVAQKLDGSLVMVFYYKGFWKAITKQSFNSKQVEIAETLLSTKYQGYLQNFDKEFTYIFELVGPQNPHIVEYDTDKLVLLTVLTKGGTELGTSAATHWPDVVNQTNRATVLHLPTLLDLLNNMSGKNGEGYILKFQNGLRAKLKAPDYIRLHKSHWGLSTKLVWEHLRDDKFLECPDEFHPWVKRVQAELLATYTANKLHWDNQVIALTEKVEATLETGLAERDKVGKLLNELGVKGTLHKLFFAKNYGDNYKELLKKHCWEISKPNFARFNYE